MLYIRRQIFFLVIPIGLEIILNFGNIQLGNGVGLCMIQILALDPFLIQIILTTIPLVLH